jgi:hypothetical protein
MSGKVTSPEPASVSHLLALRLGAQESSIGPARGNQNQASRGGRRGKAVAAGSSEEPDSPGWGFAGSWYNTSFDLCLAKI